jgi:hypothetical protein
MDSAGGAAPDNAATLTPTINTSSQTIITASGSGNIKLGSFTTSPSLLTSTLIVGGLWDLNIYATSGVNGVSLYAIIDQVDADGSNPVAIVSQTSADAIRVFTTLSIVTITLPVPTYNLTNLTKRIRVTLWANFSISTSLNVYFRADTVSHIHTTILQVVATGDTGPQGSTGYTGNTGPAGVMRPLQSISYYLSSNIPVTTTAKITYDTLDASNSYGTVGFSYATSTGTLTNTTSNILTVLVSGQVLTDNRAFDLNVAQPTIAVKKGGNAIITSSVINFQGSSFSTTVVLGNADTITIWYSQYFGSTVNVLGGQYSSRITYTQLDTVEGSTLIGTDLNNVAYTQYGLATPFINIGPSISSPGAIGGWQVGPTGTMGSNDYTLVAQQNSPQGLTGPLYTLLTPSVKILAVNNATSGYTFRPVDRGSIFLLTSTSNSAPFGLSQGFLSAQDAGFYVTLRNGNTLSLNYTIPIYAGTLVPSTGNSVLSTSAILYWTGTAFMLYM